MTYACLLREVASLASCPGYSGEDTLRMQAHLRSLADLLEGVEIRDARTLEDLFNVLHGTKCDGPKDTPGEYTIFHAYNLIEALTSSLSGS